MEVNPASPRPSEILSAELVGLQYGLASAKDIVQFSVMGATHPVKGLRDLVDPRVGLPAEEEKCLTCGGTTYENCTGHFGHVRLPEPIFHPTYVRLLQRILQKICLGCGAPKPNKLKIQIQETTASEENVKRRIQSRGLDTDFSIFEKEQPGIPVVADPIESFAGDGVVLLSSDEEDHAPAAIPLDILKVVSQRSSLKWSRWIHILINSRILMVLADYMIILFLGGSFIRPKMGPISIMGLCMAGSHWLNCRGWHSGTQTLQNIILLATGTNKNGGYFAPKSVFLATYIGLCLIWAVLNSFALNLIALIDIVSMYWLVVGGTLMVIMLPLVATNTQSASYVFTKFEMSSSTCITILVYGVLLSWLVSQYSLFGYDSAAHLTEETRGVDVNGPIAILSSIAMISVFGWGFILALTFSIKVYSFIHSNFSIAFWGYISKYCVSNTW